MSDSQLSHYECGHCAATAGMDELIATCPACGGPLLARYDLQGARADRIPAPGRGIWRWSGLLPVPEAGRIELGTGDTPLLPTTIGAWLGTGATWIKDEAANPTASFKARGMAVAIGRARALGARSLVVPSAGNAACAAAAYAAAAGLPLTVFMPADVPDSFRIEARAYAARVELVDGLIDECGRRAQAMAERDGSFNLATFREPGRVEGKKTMGFEIAEQMGWRLPEVLIYPTGGGTGIVALWKAFEELEALGLIGPERPRLVMVQAETCAPLVRAFEAGNTQAEPWENGATVADGLRVPKSFGDRLVLGALRRSRGRAVTVSDGQMLEYARIMASKTGIFPCPEGAACLAAQVKLAREGWIGPEDRVVLFNTGSALKYLHLWPNSTHPD
ncbi:threonine synthase [Natronospira bacteriovora]|uniref:Threonine synthase n=1 Tax=Natronospira bacteriovora TaxID=3069753 RepID=A0ABU0W7N5_9GAMM|nr:threonine synthase [Natronospira sp. AB-CW4]MDQ2069778.1 threonine synthase [Natronospira sp. AB-CW4]